MYTIKNVTHRQYYREHIEKDIREFKLECDIADNSNISSVKIDYDLASGGEEYFIGVLAAA